MYIICSCIDVLSSVIVLRSPAGVAAVVLQYCAISMNSECRKHSCRVSLNIPVIRFGVIAIYWCLQRVYIYQDGAAGTWILLSVYEAHFEWNFLSSS